MKIKTLRIFCAVLAVFTLLACLPIGSYAAKAKISTVVATSDINEIAVLYGRPLRPEFNISEGAPAYFNNNWVTCWQTYNGETEQWENYSERFVPGKYRTSVQVRVDGSSGITHELADDLSVTIDGNVWTLDGGVSGDGTYSCVFVNSPEIIIEDDPNVSPPVEITDLYLNLVGYNDGKKFSEVSLECYNGSEYAVELVSMQFLDMSDKDGNQIPDCMDPSCETYVPITDETVVSKNTDYALVAEFKAREGYDLYALDGQNVHMNALVPEPSFCIISYNEESDSYMAVMFLSRCTDEIRFTKYPTDTVGYYGRLGFGAVEISWEVNVATDSFKIYKWD